MYMVMGACPLWSGAFHLSFICDCVPLDVRGFEGGRGAPVIIHNF